MPTDQNEILTHHTVIVGFVSEQGQDSLLGGSLLSSFLSAKVHLPLESVRSGVPLWTLTSLYFCQAANWSLLVSWDRGG